MINIGLSSFTFLYTLNIYIIRRIYKKNHFIDGYLEEWLNMEEEEEEEVVVGSGRGEGERRRRRGTRKMGEEGEEGEESVYIFKAH